jgi:hypothetical protein
MMMLIMLFHLTHNPLGGPFGPMPHIGCLPFMEDNMVEIMLEINPIKHFIYASKDQLHNHVISINEQISHCFDKLDKLKGEHDVGEFSMGEIPHN